MSGEAAVAEVRAGHAPATRRVLFGSVGSNDVVEAVVRRIRGAIALGLFADGERLPREADLVQSLGVTAFAMRESLGVLRDDGLIVTRPGRGGGSFVKTPADSAYLAAGSLARLSATELRDLGDWRRMLVAGSASLAAQRASKSNNSQLREYAHAVRIASSALEARRAHGRFHLELAAAAQSIRLSKAEFGMQEELDWLLGLALDDPPSRHRIADGLEAVAKAVAEQRPTAARAAAEAHSVDVIESLTQQRLALLSAHPSSAPLRPGSRSLKDELARICDVVLAPLCRLAESCAQPLAESPTGAELRARVLSAAVASLRDLEFPVHGLGVLSEVGVVVDEPYWVDWWHQTAAGPVKDRTHVTDPNREYWYDYSEREYMVYPRQKLTAWAAGPYVDYGGVDDYIITVSCPIVANGRFLGVAAADLLVSDLERHLAPWLVQSGSTSLFLNAERRVVTSNTAAHAVGDVVHDTGAWTTKEVGRFGWIVVDEANSRPAGPSSTIKIPR